MKHNGCSAKVRLLLDHITWIHILAKFEELISTSPVISKISFEQKEI